MFFFLGPAIHGTMLFFEAGQGSELQLPVSHAIMRIDNLYSTVYCVVSLVLILCFVFLRAIISTKCPSVYPASSEKKRKKTFSLEIKLKITTQLYANCKYSGMFKSGPAKV